MLYTLDQMNTALKKLVDLLDNLNTTQHDMLLELEGMRDQLTIMNEEKEKTDGTES